MTCLIITYMNYMSQEDFKKISEKPNYHNHSSFVLTNMSNMKTDVEIKVIEFSIYHKINI